MKILNCPKCGVQPERITNYLYQNARIIMHCPECGLSLKRWWSADIEYCAVDEAIKDWNKAVKSELKARNDR